MQKTIAFFESAIDPEKYPFSSRELYYHSHQEYLLAMKRAGARAYFVTGNDSYLGEGRFSRAWTIDRVSEVKDFIQVGEIKADVVFDKAGFVGFQGQDVTLVTDHKLRPLLSDKAAIYKRFGQFQPRSVVCQTREELDEAVASMPGDIVVVKNPVGSGGAKVYIQKKSELNIPSNETYPLLVQEFMDMTDGAPGLAEGPHDLRVLMTGPTVIGATLRQPAAGELHSNVSRGGSERLVGYDEIPAEVRDMASEIDAGLEDLPRYYSIDFAHGKQGWRLIELNNEPGLFRESNGPLARGFMDALAEYLVSLA